MTDATDSAATHHDLTPSRIKKDEDAVQSLEDLFEVNWTNPFQVEETELINISTGVAAPPEVSIDLLLAQRKGEEARQKFQECRLESGKQFYERIPRLNLKTFHNIEQGSCVEE